MQPIEIDKTIFGVFTRASKGRLDLTYDFETAAISSFRAIAAQLACSALVDVGANVGVYSVHVGGLGCIQHVHAFEPSPAAFDLLKANVGLQPHADKIHCYAIAASDRAGEAHFKIVSPLAGNNQVTDADGSIDVPCLPIDELLPIKGERIAVKVDVEGHEQQVLAGMRTLLRSNECYLQVECLGGEQRVCVERILHELGYRWLFSLRDDHLFLSRRLEAEAAPLMRILAQSVSADLKSLLTLRQEKRALAKQAKQLWLNVGYKYDPVLA